MARSLKINCFLPPHFDYPVGGLLVCYEYANRLAARGHEVTLIHGWGSAALAARYDVTLPAEVHPPKRYWFPFDERVTSLHVREFEPARLPSADVALNAPGYFDPYPERLGLPVLFFQGFGWLLPEHERMGLRPGPPKIGISRWVCDELRARGVAESEIVYLPNGVDHSVFRLSSPIEHRPPRIAMLWAEARVKRSELGLAVVERVREKVSSVEAVFFGVDPRPEHLPEWIEYRRLPTRESLVNDVYNASAVCLCTSAREGFYLPGLEALATGCALVTTDNGGVRDYAEPEVTALISESDSPEALASSVLRLLEDKPLRVRIATNGLRRAGEFSWDRGAEQLERHLLDWTEG